MNDEFLGFRPHAGTVIEVFRAWRSVAGLIPGVFTSCGHFARIRDQWSGVLIAEQRRLFPVADDAVLHAVGWLNQR